MSSTISGVIAGGYTVSLSTLSGAAIDPTKETWVIMHGRGQGPANMQYFAADVQAQRPNAQVLVLDWTTAAIGTLAETEDRTPAVGAWIAQALTGAGFAAGVVNMIGFSYGCYTASEAARALPGGANVIVAIDPGIDAAGSAFDPLTVNYAALSKFSMSFYAGPQYGNAAVAGTADEAIYVRNSSHSGAYDVAHRLIELNSDFALSRLLAHQFANWAPDQFDLNGVLGSGPFDAAVNTTNGGYTPTTVDTVTPTSGGGSGSVTFTSGADDVTLSVPGVNIDALGGNDHVRGTASADYIYGNTGDDKLEGLAGNDTLLGGAGVDILDGGAGADRMEGGDGADTYLVDDAGDLVIESSATGGTDLVQASVSYTLGDNVEKLTLTGSAANATGNSLANILVGNGVANTLDGKVGADLMYGGAGDDIYMVDDVGDRVYENAGEGTDLIISTISVPLGPNTENLTLIGSASINGTGNGLANQMLGNEGWNTLKGDAGADVLNGGGGRDSLIGGLDADKFVFTSAKYADADYIVDFSHAQGDVIQLENAAFTALQATPGTLDANAFYVGTRAHDGDDRVIYDAANGYLYYDADGSGAGSQVLIANLTNHAALTASDILII